MPEQVYCRDPKHPEEIHGPFTVADLKRRVMRGELRRTHQVSLDRKSWMEAHDYDPELFAGTAGAARSGFMAALQDAARLGFPYVKQRAAAAWQFLRAMSEFYWTNRAGLWQLFAEYVPFFREHGNRKEIRVSGDDKHDKVSFDGELWSVELPDCCVVCGEPVDGRWNSEQRSVPNLTWPLLAPLNGLLLGFVIGVIFWTGWIRWLMPLGLLAGLLIGYRLKSEVLVTVRFHRCREHLNRTRIPTLRTFRKSLIIGVGDRSVWRQFHYGKSGIETPLALPTDPPATPSEIPPDVSHKLAPPPPTIKLAGDDDEENPPSG